MTRGLTRLLTRPSKLGLSGQVVSMAISNISDGHASQLGHINIIINSKRYKCLLCYFLSIFIDNPASIVKRSSGVRRLYRH